MHTNEERPRECREDRCFHHVLQQSPTGANASLTKFAIELGHATIRYEPKSVGMLRKL
jgi:hypothetical protein